MMLGGKWKIMRIGNELILFDISSPHTRMASYCCSTSPSDALNDASSCSKNGAGLNFDIRMPAPPSG
jgi:hypothetical protein